MKGTLFLCLSFYFSIIQGASNSDPVVIFNCDALSDKWGCDPRFWIGGDRLQCQNKSVQLMPWATKPTRSDCYHVILGEETNPATHYVPNEHLSVNIRVTCYKMLYRGLLLYAVDSNEKKVGEWDIPITEPPMFKQPWQNIPNHECAPSVMHASAEWKAYHHVIYFKAPPAGTGSITFRSLFKFGNANTGDFFWPQEDTVLTEGTPKSLATVWRQSTPGQSCSEACGGVDNCNEEALQLLKGKTSFVEAITPNHTCQVPLLSGCGSDGATYDPVNEYCYYVEPNCAAQNRTVSSVTCATKQNGVIRFCPCTNTNTNTDQTNTDQTIIEETTIDSPASYNQPGFFSMLFILPLLFSNLPQRVLFGMVLVAGVALGHNWIPSVSRSPAASTYRPCKPPLTDLPHAQVGPNQAFQIEWMTAHRASAYFVIVHSRDADKLKLHTNELLEDYIANAPNGTNQAFRRNLQRYHLKTTPTLDNDFVGNYIPNYFEALIPANDSRYFHRPPAFGGADLIYQFQFKESELQYDVRVSYRSAKYPWIEAVSKFKHTTMNPNKPDTANFYIPGFGGLGRYIVHYMWEGYYDCVDVDYKAAPVADVYGIPFNGTRWGRIDHCLFEDVRNIFHASRIYTDPKFCLNACVNTKCYGVNVVPIMAPSSAYSGFKAPSNTSVYPEIFGTDIYVPWGHEIFNDTRGLFTQNPSPTKYMCYTVRPREFTDTLDEYTISNDPNDPIFYSTCFYRFQGNFFEDYVNSTVDELSLPWIHSSKCIDCQSKTTNSDPYLLLPKWNSPDVCINCDKEPAAAEVPEQPVLVESGVRCDGSPNGGWSRAAHHSCSNDTSCWIPLRVLGRNNNAVSLEECQAMAAEDSRCSSHYIYRTSNSFCFCYSKSTCCKSCSRTPDAIFNTYELTSQPDPTCANGILSADRSACCSSSCGPNNCTPTTTPVDPVGFCCSTCISRPCSQYGPPCKM